MYCLPRGSLQKTCSAGMRAPLNVCAKPLYPFSGENSGRYPRLLANVRAPHASAVAPHGHPRGVLSANTDTNTRCYANCDINTYCDTHTSSNLNADVHADVDSYPDLHTNTHANTDADAHSYRYSHAQADLNTDAHGYLCAAYRNTYPDTLRPGCVRLHD